MKLPPRCRQYSDGLTLQVLLVSGLREVSKAVREGLHHATATYALVKVTESAASASRCGVCICLHPYAPSSCNARRQLSADSRAATEVYSRCLAVAHWA